MKRHVLLLGLLVMFSRAHGQVFISLILGDRLNTEREDQPLE
jgi:hypothetical protein